MLDAAADWLWETLRDEIGDHVRITTVYDGLEFESHVREGVLYREKVARKIVDENIVDGFSEKRLEEKMGLGPLDGVVRFYRDVWVVNWVDPQSNRRGALVSLDRFDEAEQMNHVQEVVDFLAENGPRLHAGKFETSATGDSQA